MHSLQLEGILQCIPMADVELSALLDPNMGALTDHASTLFR